MKVKCYDGSLAERRTVRRIKGEYYKHEDILNIDGTRFRCTNVRIIRDLATNKLIDSFSERPRGFRSTRAKISRTGNVLFEKLVNGEARNYPAKVFYFNEDTVSTFIDLNSIQLLQKKNLIFQNTISGAWWIKHTSDGESRINKRLQSLAAEYQGFMYERLQYSMNKNYKYFKDHKYTPKSKLGLDHLLGGLTFGGEFETSSGKISHDKLIELGVAPLRDGSISGYEFTTIPLTSINHLKDIINVLNANCNVTYKDSLHFHVGGVPHTKEFLLKMFKVAQLLQNEFYQMVPSYKLKDIHHIKRREQNYTNKLPIINIKNETAINRIVEFLSDGKDTSDNISIRPHPSDPSGEHKWQIRNRYTCINFVNFIYGGAGTVEFRLHQGTVNPYKAIYWLLINIALVRYAMAHTVEEIQSGRLTIAKVISEVYHNEAKVESALIAYVTEAKKYFAAYDKDDIHYNEDSRRDKSWEPTIKLW